MRKNIGFYILICLLILVIFLGPDYDTRTLNSGFYFLGGETTLGEIKELNSQNVVIFEEEGLYGTIIVEYYNETIIDVIYQGEKYKLKINPTPFGPIKIMKINGKVQCGSSRMDLMTTGLLGGLSTVLGKKGDVLNIGLGCAQTLGVLELGDYDDIETIEIDPIVIEASKEFDNVTGFALEDQRSEIIIDDARNYLFRNDKKYDVIVNEPSHPYNLGSSNLLTKEFYEILSDHLKTDGIVIQWVPYRQLRSCDYPGFAIIYRTFSSVFPNVYIFQSKVLVPNIIPQYDKIDIINKMILGYDESYDDVNPHYKEGEIIFVGSHEKINIFEIMSNFEESESNLRDYYEKINLYDINNNYLYSSGSVIGFKDDVVINTDNDPILDYIASRNLYENFNNCKARKGLVFIG